MLFSADVKTKPSSFFFAELAQAAKGGGQGSAPSTAALATGSSSVTAGAHASSAAGILSGKPPLALLIQLQAYCLSNLRRMDQFSGGAAVCVPSNCAGCFVIV